MKALHEAQEMLFAAHPAWQLVWSGFARQMIASRIPDHEVTGVQIVAADVETLIDRIRAYEEAACPA